MQIIKFKQILSFLAFVYSGNLLIVAQEPNYEPSFNHSTSPTIEKIASEEIKDRKKPKISTDSEYYLKARDENDIVIQRKANEPAKVHIQGRGSMNTIHIIDQKGIPDDQPMWQKDFRGTVYESLDLSKLPDGDYIIKLISPHRSTENKLTIKTILQN
jgi:hypothetical protein